jgi:hypothetical protein
VVDAVDIKLQPIERLLERSSIRIHLNARHLERDEVLLRMLLHIDHSLLQTSAAALNLLHELHFHALMPYPHARISSSIMQMVGLTEEESLDF